MTIISDAVEGWLKPSIYTSSTLPHLQLVQVTAVTVAFYLAHSLYIRYVYNVHFHPLAKFPGPRAAALSDKWLWNLQSTGKAEQTLEALHQELAAHAIRIAPNELHIDDTRFYKTIYSQSSPYLKPRRFYDAFAGPHNIVTECDPALHKIKRKALNPFFSRQSMLKLQPMITERLTVLCSRLRELEKDGRVFTALNGFRCLTVDIISTMTSGKNPKLLETSNSSFYTTYVEAFDTLVEVTWDMVYRPVLREILLLIPPVIAVRISSTAAKIQPVQDHSLRALHAFRTKPKEDSSSYIYSVLTHLPTAEAASESTNLLIAGSDTTAYTLTLALFHICQSPRIITNLVNAIDAAFPDAAVIPDLPTLEAIPYLAACVKESLRIAQPIPGRLPRIVPSSANLVVDGQVVPPGSIVGISAYTMHGNNAIWGENADSFDPERWLRTDGKALEQHLVPFSKGVRACVGQNLAMAELVLTLAVLLRRFDFEVDEGSLREVRGLDRFVTALPKPGVLLKAKSRT